MYDHELNCMFKKTHSYIHTNGQSLERKLVLRFPSYQAIPKQNSNTI